MVYFLFVEAASEDSEANPPSNSIINLLPVLVCVCVCGLEERFTFRNRKYSERKKNIYNLYTRPTWRIFQAYLYC